MKAFASIITAALIAAPFAATAQNVGIAGGGEKSDITVGAVGGGFASLFTPATNGTNNGALAGGILAPETNPAGQGQTTGPIAIGVVNTQ